MTVELHDVTVNPLFSNLSFTVSTGQLLTVSGRQGAGKTSLLRALLGFIALDAGHISIDGELLTPLSAPYFRRHTAYVPQQLSMPQDVMVDGLETWNDLSVDQRYLLLLSRAVSSGRPLLFVDEPLYAVATDTAAAIDRQLRDAAAHGCTVIAVNDRINENMLRL